MTPPKSGPDGLGGDLRPTEHNTTDQLRPAPVPAPGLSGAGLG
ncbi:MAG: hypothetical protein ABR922_15130 [Streptosporangiaceae bacterium]